MSGIVIFLDFKNECGYIAGDDGLEYYFEFSSLNFPEKILKEKLRVGFSARFNQSMAYAVGIFLI